MQIKKAPNEQLGADFINGGLVELVYTISRITALSTLEEAIYYRR